MRFIMVVLLASLLLGACTADRLPPLEERVPQVAGEVLYTDILSEQVPSDEAVFFGVRIGDPVDAVVALHGPPEVNKSYRFGQVVNMEYAFGQNDTAVLYHAERGVVTSILLTRDAAPLLVGLTRMDLSLPDVYGLLGVPDLSVDRPGERVFFYDSLGYEVYLQKRQVDRVFFTLPDRGIAGPGRSVNVSNATNVSAPQEAPQNGAGGNASNRAPVICVQVVTPAVSPEGVCVEYATPCDIPAGWERVEACP